MRKILLSVLLLPAFTTAAASTTCAAVTKTLLGLSLGPVQNYSSGLHTGLRRSGTAELIAEVGFETIEGSTEGISFPRIMAFFDRGQFTGVTSIARIASEKDSGFERIVATVAAAANSPAKLAGGIATFECEEDLTLSVEPTRWADGPAIKVRLMNEAKRSLTNAYITEYCADPGRRRPQDACKK